MPEAVDIVNSAQAQFVLLGRDFTGVACHINACGYLVHEADTLAFKQLFPNKY